MRVGWLVDEAPYVGGAELTQTEFRAAAPDGVEIVDCPPGSVDDSCDVYAVHNCVTYTVQDLQPIRAARAIKYHNDVGSWLEPSVRESLDKHAIAVCCSPLQAEFMRLDDAVVIPPPVNLARFENAAASVNGDRSGTVCVASWRNMGKGALSVVEWAAENGPVDFFGDGPFAPNGSRPVSYESMPSLLAYYETFVFLPTVIEPFGRVVAEAWAAGCELVINDLVGAKWWITNHPEALETASRDFWEVITCES